VSCGPGDEFETIPGKLNFILKRVFIRMSSRANARSARSRLILDRFTLIVLVVFVVVASITAILAFVWSRSFFASFSLADIAGGAPPIVIGGQNDPSKPGFNATLESLPNIAAPIGPLDAAGPTPVPWDGASRVTILVMGMDYRDWEAGNDIPRTDTMILFSIDPLTKTAGMMSIPRDLWVTIPGMENNRINTAYRWGELYELPGGGPGLAMKTVEGLLGVPVQYYALLDFNSFERFIDTMGGLDMHIREEIVVDPIGPGNTKTLEVGVQTLDGATALAYARNRYDGDGDFSRSSRQQEVIMAVREQILTFNQLPTLVAKSPALYQELQAGIRTNLTLDQVIRLAWLASSIEEGNIKKGVFDPHKHVQYADVMSNEGNQAVLIPVYDQIRLLRDEIFASNGPANPATVDNNPGELMKVEAARVFVRNGTSTVGLAGKTSELLRADGMNIVGEDNAEGIYGQTTIIDYSGKPYTINYLIKKFNLENPVIKNRFDPNGQADIEVILGEDWARQQ
jgi:polyisoprenyl-teichoic acid--peptidoglycan teichoic acid transferase